MPSRSTVLALGNRKFPSSSARTFPAKSLLGSILFALALVCAPHSFALGTDTTTVLSLSSSSASGTAVTLTATVKTVGNVAVSPGLVTFCDASATYCNNSAVVGTAQLTSAGTATLKFVPGIGSHSYKAVFAGTTLHNKSTSSSKTLAVTGTYPTTSAISSTRSAGNYTLTAKVVGSGSVSQSPSGTISFLDTTNSNYVVGAASLGSAVVAQTLTSASGSSSTGTNPVGSATGDFNGDGKPDLAVANKSGVNVLLGSGTGTFTVASGSPLTAGTTPIAVAVGDFNSDGEADLAVANNGSGTVSIFMGNGGGTFAAAVGYSTGSQPNAIAIGDFNDDGNPDLAITNGSSNSLTILLGSTTGVFTTSTGSPVAVGSGPFGLTAADFNGDGQIDLAVTNMSTTTVTILLGDGTGSFS